MAVGEIPAGTAVVTWEANIDKYIASMKKLQAHEAKLHGARAKAQDELGAQFDKISKLGAQANRTTEDGAKTWLKMSSGISQAGTASEAFGKKLGGIGKQIGGMLAGFGIGLGISAVTSIFDAMFSVSDLTKKSVKELTEMIDVAEDVPLLQAWNRELQIARDRAREVAEANKWMDAALARTQSVIEKYSATQPLVKFKTAMDDVSRAMSTGALSADEGKRAIADFRREMENATRVAQGLEKLVTVDGITELEGDAGRRADARAAQSAREAAAEQEKARRRAAAARREAENARRLREDRQTAAALFGTALSPEQQALKEHQAGLAADFARAEREHKADLAAVERAGELRAATEELRAWGAEPRAAIEASEESWLTSVIGPIEEFDQYAMAFDLISGSIGAAYDAMVDGEMSAGQAVKSVVRERIKGWGKEMSIRSIQEFAEGLSGAFSINPAKRAESAGHFLSSAKFAAGAVAAGYAASQIGTGGGGGGGGVGGGTSAPSRSGGGGDDDGGGGGGRRDTVIVINDPYSDDSPRARQLKAKKWAQMAGLGSGNDDPRDG